MRSYVLRPGRSLCVSGIQYRVWNARLLGQRLHVLDVQRDGHLQPDEQELQPLQLQRQRLPDQLRRELGLLGWPVLLVGVR